MVHDFRGATSQYILSELERRKTELKPQLVWIGAQKEPGITSRTWQWVNGTQILLSTHLKVNNVCYSINRGNSAEASVG